MHPSISISPVTLGAGLHVAFDGQPIGYVRTQAEALELAEDYVAELIEQGLIPEPVPTGISAPMRNPVSGAYEVRCEAVILSTHATFHAAYMQACAFNRDYLDAKHAGRKRTNDAKYRRAQARGLAS